MPTVNNHPNLCTISKNLTERATSDDIINLDNAIHQINNHLSTIISIVDLCDENSQLASIRNEAFKIATYTKPERT